MAAASPTRARITIESIAGAAMVVCMEGTIEIYLSTVPTVGQHIERGAPGGLTRTFYLNLKEKEEEEDREEESLFCHHLPDRPQVFGIHPWRVEERKKNLRATSQCICTPAESETTENGCCRAGWAQSPPNSSTWQPD